MENSIGIIIITCLVLIIIGIIIGVPMILIEVFINQLLRPIEESKYSIKKLIIEFYTYKILSFIGILILGNFIVKIDNIDKILLPIFRNWLSIVFVGVIFELIGRIALTIDKKNIRKGGIIIYLLSNILINSGIIVFYYYASSI